MKRSKLLTTNFASNFWTGLCKIFGDFGLIYARFLDWLIRILGLVYAGFFGDFGTCQDNFFIVLNASNYIEQIFYDINRLVYSLL